LTSTFLVKIVGFLYIFKLFFASVMETSKSQVKGSCCKHSSKSVPLCM